MTCLFRAKVPYREYVNAFSPPTGIRYERVPVIMLLHLRTQTALPMP